MMIRHYRKLITHKPIPKDVAEHLIHIAENAKDVVDRWTEYLNDPDGKIGRCTMALNRLRDSLEPKEKKKEEQQC